MQVIPELLLESIKADKKVNITLRGGSMVPYLLDGDLLEVVDAVDLVIGDIVVFRQGEMFVAHRVIGVDTEKISTRGDAGHNVEEVRRKEILGKVVAFSRGQKRRLTGSAFSTLYRRLLPYSALALRAKNRLKRVLPYS